MYKLDKAAIMTLAAEAVEEKGADHVSPLYFADYADGPLCPTDKVDVNRTDGNSMCRYVTPEGEAGCIVGQVLAKAGVPLGVLESCEGKGANKMLHTWGVKKYTDLADEGISLLTDMQSLQDHGIPWGWVMEHIGAKPYYKLIADWNNESVSMSE